ncbi:DUF3732 domain-containing protein [Yersinia enterocolitica]|uniref:DUF3732 domain-containing protein n=1 Tax=Yersinia enterocolitica TaxID=630 RepID=UPI0028A4828C|nr:DUF3732 domain-containing protein [Yersinia enterocolitica]ELI6451056.1 DUF3732 domain-containing protein [Yersinia ruckeri]EKN6115399.1 DUF3732 domain-containing protein [Yersinia enterocolitica]ELI8224325.1 DUF3732 domain-containing protein [Yersinia enterocolitica]ELI8789739.1 DUF3732 domain-containing protein [Yersinia enterocolitica]
MKFYISQLILWPKDISNKTQTLKFHDGEINIIHGVSGTGKSSIISIIDYCLGSSRCSIPVGIIREKVRWFGLKIYIKNKFYIIARNSPSYPSANDCHISISSENEQIPETISGNYSLSQFKQRLNILCQITNISIDTNYDENEKYDPPSYRDLTSFNFQPQHIVANPNTLFYRSDSYNHKEKLKKVLPYAFNMRDAVYLAKEREISIARKDLEKKEKQQTLLINAYQTWEVDISNLWNKAVELGITEGNPNKNTDDKLNNLKEIINIFDSRRIEDIFSPPHYQYTNNKYVELKSLEEKLQQEIDSINKRIRSYKSMNHYAEQFRDATKIEKESLLNIDWIKKNLKAETTCLVCGSSSNHLTPIVKSLDDSKQKIDLSSEAFITPPITDKQIENFQIQLNKLQEDINKTRKTRLQLELSNDSTKDSLSRIYLLIGNIQSLLKTMLTVERNDDLSKEILLLQEKIENLSIFFKENNYHNRELSAKFKIDQLIKGYAQNFRLTQYQLASLDYRELTISFQKKNSFNEKEFLWEIGSGANWMGYHIASFLAFHEYLMSSNGCSGASPVLSFIVIDQPSQVYFPSSSSGVNDLDTPTEMFNKVMENRNTDINETQRIFKILSRSLDRTYKNSQDKFQIIVLEHAGKSIWEGISHVNEVAHWDIKGDGLIPKDWI